MGIHPILGQLVRYWWLGVIIMAFDVGEVDHQASHKHKDES